MKSLKENWIKSIKQLNQKCSIYYCNLRFNKLTKKWYQEGARLIGGCCTTGPTEIKQMIV
ncbi:MAG: homocysteine S-methyltransferase family protein [Leuconostoc sp.]|nr:homocysteine S-methyltransferase family protein [Leuconostoc sp.]